MTFLLLLAAGALVFGGALAFTNSVEWAGSRLGLGVGAVGSVLAAVATALPESIIPITAILRGGEGADDIAIGSIIGAPFMLGTVAMMLVAASAVAFRGRREQGDAIRADGRTIRRDLIVFALCLGTALALGLVGGTTVHRAAAGALLLAYAAYLLRTVARGGRSQSEEELSPLYADPTKSDPPAVWAIALQLAASLAAVIFGAQLFVEEIMTVAERLGVSPLVLALVIAPLATELPEKLNSVIWMRDGKDALALGNITGAMVFQSTVPVSIGLAFTAWELGTPALLAGAAGLCGGGVAALSLTGSPRFGVLSFAGFASLFAAFLAFAVVA